MIAPNMPIREVIASFPATREVFARHGLDTCCGGAHPIQAAARAHGLEFEAATGRALPRELTGSYRHAITVGFVTAMITVGQACGLHHVDAEALLRDLRAAAAGTPAGRRTVPLKVIS